MSGQLRRGLADLILILMPVEVAAIISVVAVLLAAAAAPPVARVGAALAAFVAAIAHAGRVRGAVRRRAGGVAGVAGRTVPALSRALSRGRAGRVAVVVVHEGL